MDGRFDCMLAALDMDGTLLNSKHEATPYTVDVLARAAAAGKIIALSTGRTRSELDAHLEAMPFIRYVIGESGARVYSVHDSAIIHEENMDRDVVDFLLEKAFEFEMIPQVFLNGQSFMQGALDDSLTRYNVYEYKDAFRAGSLEICDMRERCRKSPCGASKLNLYFARPEDREVYRSLIKDLPLALANSIGHGLEMSPPGATKATGLRALCEYLNVPVSRVMAVGDSSNDLDIMAIAGFPVAMGNAIESVRALAHAVTDDCDHDGVAHAVEKYMLSRIDP